MKKDTCTNCGEPLVFHNLTEDGLSRVCPSFKSVIEDGAPAYVPLRPGYFRRGVIEFLFGSGG